MSVRKLVVTITKTSEVRSAGALHDIGCRR